MYNYVCERLNGVLIYWCICVEFGVPHFAIERFLYIECRVTESERGHLMSFMLKEGVFSPKADWFRSKRFVCGGMSDFYSYMSVHYLCKKT